MTYDVETARMARARSEVVDIHRELSRDYRSMTASVEALLAGSWRGKARDSYADGWADWLEGASQVLAGLEEMGSLLGVTRSTYVANDDQTAAQMAAAATRVRRRLT